MTEAEFGHHLIRADQSRPETINELNKRGLRVEAAPKWDGSVKDGITHLRSYKEIVIHDDCPKAIQQARMWRYKIDKRTLEILPALQDGNDHIWDAVRYALVNIISPVTPFQMIVA